MILSTQHLLVLYLVQQSTATTNLIRANAFNFYPHSISMHPTLNLRTPSFPEPTTTSPPSPAQLLQQNSACQLVGEALAICDALSPGFNTLQPTDQAHCLCYSSTSWMPNIFDGAVKTCADYASTAIPGAFLPLSNLEGFCLNIGDVETSPLSTVATAYQTRPSMSFSISAFAGQPCDPANEILSSCSSLTAGFSSLQPTEQAKCLCYVSTSSWCPTAFDNAIATCALYARTAASSAYAAIMPLTGFCGSVGSVLTATPASYSVATTMDVVYSTTMTAGPISTTGTSGSVGASTTMVLATTITIGGARNTQANAGVKAHKEMSEGSVVGFSFFCALLVLFL